MRMYFPAALLVAALAHAPRGAVPAGARAASRVSSGTTLVRDTTPANATDRTSAGRSALFAARVTRAADSVRAISRVPVRAPLVMFGGAEDDSTYAVPTEVERDRYEIIFGADEHCEGGNSCGIGAAEGWRRLPGTRLPRGPAVVLPGGRRGVFTDALCTIFCSNAYVTWDEGPYRYRIGFKAGHLADLRAVVATVRALP